jgi:hypothetical protein
MAKTEIIMYTNIRDSSVPMHGVRNQHQTDLLPSRKPSSSVK